MEKAQGITPPNEVCLVLYMVQSVLIAYYGIRLAVI